MSRLVFDVAVWRPNVNSLVPTSKLGTGKEPGNTVTVSYPHDGGMFSFAPGDGEAGIVTPLEPSSGDTHSMGEDV